MSFSIKGEVSEQIRPVLVAELTNRYNIPDEADDVAEYLLVLIADNKTPSEILTEIKSLVDIPIDENFINSLFEEIKKLIDQKNQAEQQAQQQVQQPQVHQPQVQQPQVQPQVQPQAQIPQVDEQSGGNGDDDDAMEDDHVDFRSLPNRPRMGQNRNARGGKFGGVGKNSRGGGNMKKSFGVQNSNNFEKMMNMNPENTKFVVNKPKGRCRHFPGCTNRDCKFAHPTKVCNAYPDCPNPPGTCNFLHPSEDQELMAKLEVSKKEYLERKLQQRSRPPPKQEIVGTGISICKYGALCSKELCPFGHPTPANIEAKVMDLVWCEGGKQCKDNNCRKAHPSPGYLAPPVESKPPQQSGFHPQASGLGGAGASNKILEQCKFGMGCTNYNCPRRHATSAVACREGAGCQRINCTYAHPIDEDCRFGLSCTNKACMFRHPEGRANHATTWVKGDDQGQDNTHNRAFAVTEDQVMGKSEQPSLV